MLIAHQSYSPGDVLAKFTPLVYGVHGARKGQHCDACFKGPSTSLSRCARCNRAFYCNRKCQRRDWRLHKLECPIFVKNSHKIILPPTPYFMMFLRAVLLFRSKPELLQEKHRIFNGQEITLEELFAREVASRDKQLNESGLACLLLEKMFGLKYGAEEGLWFRQLKYSKGSYTSSMEWLMWNDDTDEHFRGDGLVGVGFSVEHAEFNHSCAPNVFLNIDGLKVKLIAATNIEAGQELSVAHFPIHEPVAERQKNARDLILADCECQRCQEGDDINGHPINYQLVDQFLSAPIPVSFENPNLVAFLRSSDSDVGPLAVINKIFPNYHPAKTEFLIKLVKAEDMISPGGWRPETVRAAIEALKVTEPDDILTGFDVEGGDIREMAEYVLIQKKVVVIKGGLNLTSIPSNN